MVGRRAMNRESRIAGSRPAPYPPDWDATRRRPEERLSVFRCLLSGRSIYSSESTRARQMASWSFLATQAFPAGTSLAMMLKAIFGRPDWSTT